MGPRLQGVSNFGRNQGPLESQPGRASEVGKSKEGARQLSGRVIQRSVRSEKF